MQSETPAASQLETEASLPPVSPPSGKFIAQLFLVPLSIVAFLVAAFFGLPWLLGIGYASSSPERFLQRLRDSNPDVRWRAADDLAQFLHKDLSRDARWSSDPQVALEVAEQLQQALEKHEVKEAALRTKLQALTRTEDEGQRVKLLSELEGERSYLEYLTACLGNLLVPVGVPLLSETALKEDGVTPELAALKRRQAVWSLANLGRNLERFDKLPPARQEVIVTELAEEAGSMTKRGDWAKFAHRCLAGRRDGKPVAQGLDVTLAECANAESPELRKLTALALMYWSGTVQENDLMEKTLDRLTRDGGAGGQEDQRVRGVEVRYHAALALMRRGSAFTPMHLFQEMLSEEHLEKNLRLWKDGRDLPDRQAAQAALANALKVVAETRTRHPQRDLSALRPALEKLTQSQQTVLRMEAERILQLLN